MFLLLIGHQCVFVVVLCICGAADSGTCNRSHAHMIFCCVFCFCFYSFCSVRFNETRSRALVYVFFCFSSRIRCLLWLLAKLNVYMRLLYCILVLIDLLRREIVYFIVKLSVIELCVFQNHGELSNLSTFHMLNDAKRSRNTTSTNILFVFNSRSKC